MKTWLLVMLLSACSANTERVRDALTAQGCARSTIVDSGWSFFAGCSKNDLFTNVFACSMQTTGQNVSGVVCSGIFKGYTIRWY